MKIISHRANLDGIDKERENNPLYIDDCITKGFDVEIDLRAKDDNLFLGHDHAEYKINIEWLLERKENLWIHVKEYEALNMLMPFIDKLKYFCHENDKFTLLSNGYIWSHDLKNKMNNKCIIPLLSKQQVEEYNQDGFYAVCTDYVYECKKKFIREK
jgi:hypothetical protein